MFQAEQGKLCVATADQLRATGADFEQFEVLSIRHSVASCFFPGLKWNLKGMHHLPSIKGVKQ